MKRSKYHFLPTKKIIEILDHPHLQGIDGKDFWNYKEELEQVLWERQGKEKYLEPQDIPCNLLNKGC